MHDVNSLSFSFYYTNKNKFLNMLFYIQIKFLNLIKITKNSAIIVTERIINDIFLIFYYTAFQIYDFTCDIILYLIQ